MRAFLLTIVCAIGCGDPPRARVVEAPMEESIEAPMQPLAPRDEAPPEHADASDWLAACAVDDTSFAGRTLYTWTREEQIEELRREGLLITRGRVRGELSRFDTELDGDRHPVAAHLRRNARGRRYAWV